MSKSDPVLLFRQDGATAIITLNRPTQRNALNIALQEALATAIERVRLDDGVKSVILTGAGGHFSAGGDLKMLLEQRAVGISATRMRQNLQSIHHWLAALIDLEKPVIAAVSGSVVGAGLSLAMASDFVIASHDAQFCCAFGRIGLVPDLGAMYLLPRHVGLSKAKELVYTARNVSATEAKEIGLVYQLVDTDPLQAALAMARRFDAAPIHAIGMSKAIMNRSFETMREDLLADEATMQAICLSHPFHADAQDRFIAKMPPRFNWPNPEQDAKS